MRRHSFDIISFLFGALFVAAGTSAILFDDAFTRFDGRWVWPAVFVVGGVAVLATTWGRREHENAQPEETPDSPIQ